MATRVLGSAPRREGTAKLRMSNGTPVYETQYSYIVEADSVVESRRNVLQTPGIPRLNSVEPEGFAVCTGIDAKQWSQNPKYWTVTCDFSSEVSDGSGSEDPTEDPEIWQPVYETKFENYDEVLVQDLSGVPVANTAGDMFPTGLQVTRTMPVWDFFQIESASVTDETILSRNEVVNSDVFKGRQPKTLLCVIVSSIIGRYYGQLRRLTQYRLKYKKDNWTTKRIDQGNRFLLGTEWGTFDVMPSPLDGFGGALPAGDDLVVLEFDRFEQKQFSSFLRT